MAFSRKGENRLIRGRKKKIMVSLKFPSIHYDIVIEFPDGSKEFFIAAAAIDDDCYDCINLCEWRDAHFEHAVVACTMRVNFERSISVQGTHTNRFGGVIRDTGRQKLFP